jgi:hypothetical protein
MTRETIAARVEGILGARARVLSDEEFEQSLSLAKKKFFPALDTSCERRSIADAFGPEIRELLTGWGLRDASKCYVLWLDHGAGATMAGVDFVEKYDDFWYPGADDVWLLLDRGTKLIVLTHEEEACLLSPRAEARP